jgi:hypothetical protein
MSNKASPFESSGDGVRHSLFEDREQLSMLFWSSTIALSKAFDATSGAFGANFC